MHSLACTRTCTHMQCPLYYTTLRRMLMQTLQYCWHTCCTHQLHQYQHLQNTIVYCAWPLHACINFKFCQYKMRAVSPNLMLAKVTHYTVTHTVQWPISSLVPRPLSVFNVARKKRESLVREVTHVTLYVMPRGPKVALWSCLFRATDFERKVC